MSTKYEYIIGGESVKAGKAPGVHQQQDTIGGEALNILIPQQFYQSPLTQEQRGQDFKIIDLKFSIPGFTPWWDLVSIFGPIASFPVGVATGVFDKGYIEEEVDSLYKGSCKVGVDLAQIAGVTKWEPHGGGGGGSGGGDGGDGGEGPAGYSTLIGELLRNLYGDRVVNNINYNFRGNGNRFSYAFNNYPELRGGERGMSQSQSWNYDERVKGKFKVKEKFERELEGKDDKSTYSLKKRN